MSEMPKKIFYSLFAIYFVVSIACGAYLSYRLERTKQQLESVRMELELASDQQRELREIIRGTNEILSESFDTLSGIRGQLKTIRESYEAMENLLYSSGVNNDTDNGTVDSSIQK